MRSYIDMAFYGISLYKPNTREFQLIRRKIMATRSTINFSINKKRICSVYQQYDGYIEGGVGDDIKEFIKTGTFCNGIPSNKIEDKTLFNGFECFIAQYIAKNKLGTGGLYMSFYDTSQAYTYNVDFDTETNSILVKAYHYKRKVEEYTERIKV